MRHNKYRFLVMIVAGFILSVLFKLFIFTNLSHHNPLYDFVTTIVITVVLWETNLRIDSWLNKKYPWVANTKKRFFIQLSITLLYNSLMLYLLMYTYHCTICKGYHEAELLMKGSFLIGLFVTFFILATEVGSQFFKNWKQSLIEVEKYKTESVNAQLQNLKNQINPHFLFNNLSVLSSLVYKNQDKAVNFINELSKVYRYVLDNRNNELVCLSEELSFLNHYIYLLKIRFEQTIHFEISILESDEQKLIPPMCLQMLVENAIKHNEVSTQNPLSIFIVSNGTDLEIKNNKQARQETEESCKTGLINIQKRYAYFTDRLVKIMDDEKTFTVTLPLIAHS